MISEGLIALVWAAAGVTCYESTSALLAAGGGNSKVVFNICNTTMGHIGCVLAMLGVIACPITSGDTAYRSARLTIADWFKIDQSNLKKRFFVTLPLLISGFIIGQLDYSVVWRYFSWSNQTLATLVLWACSVYLLKNKKNWFITVVPATYMTAVVTSYFVSAPECLGSLWAKYNIAFKTSYSYAVAFGIFCALLALSFFLIAEDKYKEKI